MLYGAACGASVLICPACSAMAGVQRLACQLLPMSSPWSSLVEGDEQLDQPNSQTTLELYHAYVA